MPEAGFLPIPKKLLAAGVKDMVRISDARMSGTAYGTIVLHVAPEAAVGGPLALVRDGDKHPAERQGARGSICWWTRRSWPSGARRSSPRGRRGLRGYDKLFRETVLQAPDGCDFDFLRR